MTSKKLSQLSDLNREISQDKQRLQALEAALQNNSVKIAGLPHIDSLCGNDALVKDIVEIKNLIERKTQRCIAEYNRLMRYIEEVEDSFMRQILTFRYVNGFSWVQIALHMGGGNTEDSVRIAHKRFLDKK